MAVMGAYVRTPSKFQELLKKLPTAGVPERVSFEFLKTLDCKSSNDRMMIQVLKGIGFLDANGVPTAIYKAYRNPKEGPRVLAKAIHEAYSDVFMANTKANELGVEDIKGIIATKVDKGDAIVANMAKTFKAMTEMADFSGPEPVAEEIEEAAQQTPTAPQTPEALQQMAHLQTPSFHYNIELHLPTTTDITVYNAIFRSLRENLL
jgi:hypothetical protein